MSIDLQLIAFSTVFKCIASFENMSMVCSQVYDSLTMSVDLQLIPCSAVFKYIAGFEDMSMDCLQRYEC